MKKFVLKNKDIHSLKCRIGKVQEKRAKTESHSNYYFEEDFQNGNHSQKQNAYQFNIKTAI